MLEALQFMVAQLRELLEPDAGSLPKASVEGIQAHIWEVHESALHAEVEEQFVRFWARLDLDCFMQTMIRFWQTLSCFPFWIQLQHS